MRVRRPLVIVATCGRLAARVLAGDQHRQLERVEQGQLRELFRRRHGRDHVPALDRLLEDSV